MNPAPHRNNAPIAAFLLVLLLLVGASVLAVRYTGSISPDPGQDPGTVAPRDGSSLVAGALEIVDPQNPERPFFHDFGVLDYGVEIPWSVTMRNVGTEPMVIETAYGACGCTRLVTFDITDPATGKTTIVNDFSKDTVATVPVNGTATMNLQILSHYTAENQSKLALFRVVTNALIDPFLTFELRFFPQRSLTVSPKRLEMKQVPTTHGGEHSVKIITASAKGLAKVHRILSAPEGIETRLESFPFGGEMIWRVYATVPPMTPMGVIRGEIELAISDLQGEGEDNRLSIPVFVRVVADAFVDPGLLTFGATPEGTSKSISSQLICLIPGATLEIVEARFENVSADAFRVEMNAVRPEASGRSKRWEIIVHIDESHPVGYIQGELVLKLAEPLGGVSGDNNDEIRTRLGGAVVVQG